MVHGRRGLLSSIAVFTGLTAMRLWLRPPLRPKASRLLQHNGTAYYFEVSALADGTFTVTNSRNGLIKTYKAEDTRTD